MPYDENEQITENDITLTTDTIVMDIDCVKCGNKEGFGYITFGNRSMCTDCGNKFNDWMYEKLVDEWLKEK